MTLHAEQGLLNVFSSRLYKILVTVNQSTNIYIIILDLLSSTPTLAPRFLLRLPETGFFLSFRGFSAVYGGHKVGIRPRSPTLNTNNH